MESITDKMKGRLPLCYESATDRAFIEFQVTPTLHHSFSLGHLLDYSLSANDGELPGTPPQRLQLAFSTGEVVIFGARLESLTVLLRDQKLALVRPLPERFEGLKAEEAWVASIVVRKD